MASSFVVIVEATFGGNWDALTIRLPHKTPEALVAEHAIAKARAEMGSVSKWFSLNVRKWWIDEKR